MRILLVDDSELIRRSLRRVLEPPHVVVEADGGAQGVAIAAEGGDSFDLIVCDVAMPGVDGLDVYRALKVLGSPLCDRILFLTGSVDQPRALELEAEVGPSVLLEKPLTTEVLRAFIERLRLTDRLRES